MAIHGHLYIVENAEQFFAPILLGGGPPDIGYAPCDSKVTITITYYFEFIGIDFAFYSVSTTLDTVDGSYLFPEFPGNLTPASVSLTATYYGRQYYRSEIFPYSVALRTELDIWIYMPTLPSSAGITAGQVSEALNGQGLPGNTNITASQNGLSVSGSKSEASLSFGVWVTPDLSPNLALFLDVALNGWNIHVGWPEDWCESADDILNKIKSGLQNADSSINGLVSVAIVTLLQAAPLYLSQQLATALLNSTSFQFVSLALRNHTWALSDTTDSTTVLTPSLSIGYPRFWSAR